MGQPSFQASNAVVYVTYGAFLYVDTQDNIKSWSRYYENATADSELCRVIGTALAWRYRKDASGEFLSGNRTRTGQKDALQR